MFYFADILRPDRRSPLCTAQWQHMSTSLAASRSFWCRDLCTPHRGVLRNAVHLATRFSARVNQNIRESYSAEPSASLSALFRKMLDVGFPVQAPGQQIQYVDEHGNPVPAPGQQVQYVDEHGNPVQARDGLARYIAGSKFDERVWGMNGKSDLSNSVGHMWIPAVFSVSFRQGMRVRRSTDPLSGSADPQGGSAKPAGGSADPSPRRPTAQKWHHRSGPFGSVQCRSGHVTHRLTRHPESWGWMSFRPGGPGARRAKRRHHVRRFSSDRAGRGIGCPRRLVGRILWTRFGWNRQTPGSWLIGAIVCHELGASGRRRSKIPPYRRNPADIDLGQHG